AIAIPQYQDYVTRSRWSDVLQSVGPLKQAIGECLQNNNGLNTECDSDTDMLGTTGTNPTRWIPAIPVVTAKFPNTTVATAAGPSITIVSTNPQLASCNVTL